MTLQAAYALLLLEPLSFSDDNKGLKLLLLGVEMVCYDIIYRAHLSRGSSRLAHYYQKFH